MRFCRCIVASGRVLHVLGGRLRGTDSADLLEIIHGEAVRSKLQVSRVVIGYRSSRRAEWNLL